jgi:hypothetical protein
MTNVLCHYLNLPTFPASIGVLCPVTAGAIESVGLHEYLPLLATYYLVL